MDVKSTIAKIAPTLAAALGGPLAGSAVAVISEAITGNPSATAGDLEAAISTGKLTPEAHAALVAAENEFKLKMRAFDLDAEKATLGDIQDARRANAANRDVFYLGVAVLVGFVCVCGLAVFGAYLLLFGTLKADAGTVAAVFTFVGGTVGYTASNAQSVVNFYFGSSKGSADKTDALAASVANLAKK